MSEQKIPIPAMLYNAAVGGHVTNSQQIIDVYNYFENILDKIKNKNDDKDNSLPSYLLNQESLVDYNFFDRFDQFMESFQSNDDELDEKISILYNSVFYQQFLNIGIFGMTSTGKSSVLNSILGYDSDSFFLP